MIQVRISKAKRFRRGITDPVRDFFRVLRRILKSWYWLKYGQHDLFLPYSQFGEDVFLWLFFSHKKEGFYVDIGAFHPYLYSNTYHFYKSGWRGINVEPNPSAYAKLQKLRPRDINVNCAISQEESKVQFTCDGPFSGIDDAAHLWKKHSATSRRIEISARPLASVLDEFLPANTKVDFMSIDCEGHEIMVLMSNDWSKHRPRVLLVEDHEQRSVNRLDELMRTMGYRFYFKLNFTKIFLEQTEYKNGLGDKD